MYEELSSSQGAVGRRPEHTTHLPKQANNLQPKGLQGKNTCIMIISK